MRLPAPRGRDPVPRHQRRTPGDGHGTTGGTTRGGAVEAFRREPEGEDPARRRPAGDACPPGPETRSGTSRGGTPRRGGGPQGARALRDLRQRGEPATGEARGLSGSQVRGITLYIDIGMTA